MTLNGDSKFLRITIGNLLTIITTVAMVSGMYYKFDHRISVLESNIPPRDLMQRVTNVEGKIDGITPQIIRTDTNVLWLMDKQNNK